MPEFTEQELRKLADFICGRMDDLEQCVADLRADEAFRNNCREAVTSLKVLNEKLRPYYNG